MPASTGSAPAYVTCSASPSRSKAKPSTAVPSARNALNSSTDVPSLDLECRLVCPADPDRARLAGKQVEHVVREECPARRLEHQADRGDVGDVADQDAFVADLDL